MLPTRRLPCGILAVERENAPTAVDFSFVEIHWCGSRVIKSSTHALSGTVATLERSIPRAPASIRRVAALIDMERLFLCVSTSEGNLMCHGSRIAASERLPVHRSSIHQRTVHLADAVGVPTSIFRTQAGLRPRRSCHAGLFAPVRVFVVIVGARRPPVVLLPLEDRLSRAGSQAISIDCRLGSPLPGNRDRKMIDDARWCAHVRHHHPHGPRQGQPYDS